MSNQADVRSIDALKDFRVALALYAEETLGAVATVNMEAKRTVQWVQHDRRNYWIEQVKRRREQVSSARSEVARRKLAKTPEHTPAFSEQKELLRVAEALLREAEAKVILVKKWEPILAQAVLENHASTRRISDLAASGIPRAIHLMTRLVDALEAYLREAPPTAVSFSAGSNLESISVAILAEAETEAEAVEESAGPDDLLTAESASPPID